MDLRFWGITAVALTALACSGGADKSAATGADNPATASAPDAASGMVGMAGMDQSMASVAMMESMGAHLQALNGASADSLAAALPAHRQAVANLIAQTNREMRDMGMSGDEQWNATVDSLRQDLVRLPELSGAEVRDLMPMHRDRVMHLIAMHRQMLASM